MPSVRIKREISCDRCGERTPVAISIETDREQPPANEKCGHCGARIDLPPHRIRHWAEEEISYILRRLSLWSKSDPMKHWVRTPENAEQLRIHLDDLTTLNASPEAAAKAMEKPKPPARATAQADPFEAAVIQENVKLTDEEMRKEFNFIRQHLITLMHKVESSLDQKNTTSLPCRIGQVLRNLKQFKDELAKAVEDASNQQYTDLHRDAQELAALIAGLDRQPVKVDADVVAQELLAKLADSDPVRAMLGQLNEQFVGAFFKERMDAYLRLAEDLPKLFDAVEYPYRSWEVGTKLSEEQRAARDVVLGVLRPIRDELAAWRRRHRIDEIPTDIEEPGRYDQAAHEAKRMDPTSEEAKHGTIQRVIRRGYAWPLGPLRKAEVTVWTHEQGRDGQTAAGAARPSLPPDPAPTPRPGSRLSDEPTR